ncbi:MAG: GGDEF domain-containing protein [Spirochaetales bacterium]|nr:GGDEF domain-containing protein [Spirochaetales bacterium]
MHAENKDKTQNSKPLTLGLLTEQIEYRYQRKILSGIMDVCSKNQINLVCFAGGALKSPYGYETERNRIFALVNRELLDGLLLMSGSLCNFVTQEELQEFCAGFSPLPIVSIAIPIPGIPSVVIDNTRGLSDLITHIIKVHQCRRIAFIKGPEGNPEAMLRYKVFTETLEKNGVPVIEDLIASGDFRPSTGVSAVSYLLNHENIDINAMLSESDDTSVGAIEALKKRGVLFTESNTAKPNIDAIVAANDNMAIGALEALVHKGIQVPDDLIITGFDDQEEAEFVSPPLTTVYQPLYEQGGKAVELMLRLLRNEKTEAQVTLPTRLLIRESCGCLSLPTGPKADGKFEDVSIQFMNTMGSLMEKTKVPDAEKKLKSLIERHLSGRPFLEFFNQIIKEEFYSHGDVSLWKEIIHKLINNLPMSVPSPDKQKESKEQLLYALLKVEELLKRAEAYNRLKEETKFMQLRSLIQSMSMPMEIDKLKQALSMELKDFGIRGFFLSLYDNGDNNQDLSRFIMGYSKYDDFHAPAGPVVFPSNQLIPGKYLLSTKNRYAYVAEPLFIGEEHYGFAVFDISDREFFFYETLRGQISNALKRSFLLQRRIEAEEKLKEAMNELEASNKKLEKISLQDELSGLNNRRGFYGAAQLYFNLAKRRDDDFLLFYFDLDGLKNINDTYGHQEGDVALVEASKVLKDTFRSTDILGRIGGDEFVVLGDRLHKYDLHGIMARLEGKLAECNANINKPYTISLSYGVVIQDAQWQWNSLDDLMAEADRKLYEVKKSKKFYDK